jgi:hypothetical protein
MAISGLFSAHGAECSATFGYPSRGDCTYGVEIFSSLDGQEFVLVRSSPFRLAWPP